MSAWRLVGLSVTFLSLLIFYLLPFLASVLSFWFRSNVLESNKTSRAQQHNSKKMMGAFVWLHQPPHAKKES